MNKIKINRNKKPPKRYKDLAMIYIPRPLHDKVDYENACEVLSWIMVYDESSLNQDQLDYIEAVAHFVEEYDNAHFKSKQSKKYKGIEALKSLLKEHEINDSGLSEMLGLSRSMGGKILKKERDLTVSHIKILSKKFKVNPSVFISK